jgi:hypothetical protein
MIHSKEELREILDNKYRERGAEDGWSSGKFPYGFERDLIGGYHLELEGDGKIALVGTERNRETFRKKFENEEELVNWIYEDLSKSRDMWRKFNSNID